MQGLGLWCLQRRFFWGMSCLSAGNDAGSLFAVSVLCLGGIYSLVLPPLSAPDEVSHYISAYECSNRLMGLPSVNEKGLIQIGRRTPGLKMWRMCWQMTEVLRAGMKSP